MALILTNRGKMKIMEVKVTGTLSANDHITLEFLAWSEEKIKKLIVVRCVSQILCKLMVIEHRG